MEHSFNDFDFISKEDWAKQLKKDLKGISFEDLTSIDQNDLEVYPFYTKEDLPSNIAPLFQHTDWNISTIINIQAGKETNANEKALEALGNGVSAIYWYIDNESQIDWSKLFDNIQLNIIHSFIISSDTDKFDENLHKYLKANYHSESNENFIFWLHDTIFQELVQESNNTPSNFEHLYIQGQEYSHLGLHPTQQIAYILLEVQEYLTRATKQQQLSTIKTIHIGIAQNTQFFQEISKLRALKKLLNLLINEYNIQAEIYFHASTSLTYLSAEDHPNNILRNTIAGMSAVLGGCHYLHIHPHKNAQIQAAVDAERIARNQQHLFKEESYLNKIADASYGSYTIEARTKDIAERGWKLFLDYEEKGGINNLHQQFINEVLAAQNHLLNAYQTGTLPLIGYNKYLLEEEEVLPVFEVKHFANGLQYFQLPLLNNQSHNA